MQEYFLRTHWHCGGIFFLAWVCFRSLHLEHCLVFSFFSPEFLLGYRFSWSDAAGRISLNLNIWIAMCSTVDVSPLCVCVTMQWEPATERVVPSCLKKEGQTAAQLLVRSWPAKTFPCCRWNSHRWTVSPLFVSGRCMLIYPHPAEQYILVCKNPLFEKSNVSNYQALIWAAPKGPGPDANSWLFSSSKFRNVVYRSQPQAIGH